MPSPLRLTPKSQVVLDEAAYYYDGPPDEDAEMGRRGDAESLPHPPYGRPLPLGEATKPPASTEQDEVEVALR